MKEISGKPFRNPFEEVNAVNLDDDQILKYWACPEGLFDSPTGGMDLTSLTPIFLYGARGTGKTTVLKFLSFELQEKDFISKHNSDSLEGFISSERDFLGIYYRLNSSQLNAFNDGSTSVECLEKFRLFIELILAQKYIWMLEELISKRAVKLENENALCKNLCETLFGKNLPHLDKIKKIRKHLANIQFSIEKSMDSTQAAEFPLSIDDRIPMGRLLFELPRECGEFIPEIANKKILYLLDEYENLAINQQMLLNTFIKQKQYKISFKIGTRLNGVKTHKTLDGEEYLKEFHDFRSLVFEHILLSSEEGYRDLLYRIAQKRLENNELLKTRGLTDIRKMLGTTPTAEKEAKQIVMDSTDKERHLYQIKKIFEIEYGEKAKHYLDLILCPGYPLIEKLNVLLVKRNYPIEKIHQMMTSYRSNKKNSYYSQYKNLYDKNKMALLFQLVSDYRPRRKLYVGFEMYAALSSGIIRNFLELCHVTMKYAIFNNKESILAGEQISTLDQNAAVYELSERLFKDTRSITDDMGFKVSRLVNNIGTILRILHKDEKISEPEPTYFSTEYDNLDEDTKSVVDVAEKWSFFQKTTSMKPKDRLQAHLEDFSINRMLCPKYAISYRRRGRTIIQPSDLRLLIFGNPEEQKTTREKITKMKEIRRDIVKNKHQPTLTDFIDSD